jgi:23S rRNA (uridine2552-2'-O)-methyltransferase
MDEHVDDEFVQRAKQEGWRSRAVYKLMEIQEKDRVLKPSMTVVDLGAAPGAWSQFAAKVVGSRGRVIAVDLLPMDGLPGVEFIQGISGNRRRSMRWRRRWAIGTRGLC